MNKYINFFGCLMLSGIACDGMAYTQQDDQSAFPEFSWDTIPRALILRSDLRMSGVGVERKPAVDRNKSR